MLRSQRREDRRLKTKKTATETSELTSRPINRKPFSPLTDAQETYFWAMDDSVFTFGIGPAGTGKTYVAACKAAEYLRNGDRTKVVLTRPAIEAAGEKLGFLPGTLADKFGPYMKPLMNIMIEQLGHGFVDCAIKNGRIQMIPMAFMRGETFKDSLIIADEMQNATKEQMKMLLTRVGDRSRMIIDGDPNQTDIGHGSGLSDSVHRLQFVDKVSVVRFTKSDIVRHDIIQDVLEAYEDDRHEQSSLLRQSETEEFGHLRDVTDSISGRRVVSSA